MCLSCAMDMFTQFMDKKSDDEREKVDNDEK